MQRTERFMTEYSLKLLKLRNMKKLILILVIILFMVPSCKRKTIEQLNQKNQELATLASERDSILKQLSITFEEFESTLGISDKQEDLKDRMLQSVDHLKKLLDENDQKQNSLQRMISRRGLERERLDSEIDSLNNQLRSKEEQISAMDKNIAMLKTQVDTQQLRINRLVSMNVNQNEVIQEVTSKLNTGHFVVGKPKELLNKELVVKKGGFLGLFGRVKRLNPQFNQEEFKSVDILADTLIELSGDKINIVTVHPSNTYNLIDTNNVKQLEITDPERFWQASKYLVVENK